VCAGSSDPAFPAKLATASSSLAIQVDSPILIRLSLECQVEEDRPTMRRSIDPELLLRIVLIGYLYDISSERRLVEELRMHLV
jgi:transposase